MNVFRIVCFLTCLSSTTALAQGLVEIIQLIKAETVYNLREEEYRKHHDKLIELVKVLDAEKPFPLIELFGLAADFNDPDMIKLIFNVRPIKPPVEYIEVVESCHYLNAETLNAILDILEAEGLLKEVEYVAAWQKAFATWLDRNQSEIARELIRRCGVDTNSLSIKGEYPLVKAIRQRDGDLVKALSEAASKCEILKLAEIELLSGLPSWLLSLAPANAVMIIEGRPRLNKRGLFRILKDHHLRLTLNENSFAAYHETQQLRLTTTAFATFFLQLFYKHFEEEYRFQRLETIANTLAHLVSFSNLYFASGGRLEYLLRNMLAVAFEDEEESYVLTWFDAALQHTRYQISYLPCFQNDLIQFLQRTNLEVGGDNLWHCAARRSTTHMHHFLSLSGYSAPMLERNEYGQSPLFIAFHAESPFMSAAFTRPVIMALGNVVFDLLRPLFCSGLANGDVNMLIGAFLVVLQFQDAAKLAPK